MNTAKKTANDFSKSNDERRQSAPSGGQLAALDFPPEPKIFRQSCLSVIISILVVGLSVIGFVSHLDLLTTTHKTRNADMSGAIFGMKFVDQR
jgi:hypothetical protein